MKFLVGLLLGTFSTFAADTFVLHGLTNITLGQAVYGSNEYRSRAFVNLRSNGLDGVSIHLGEADSGVFVYPSVIDDTDAGNFMSGQLYGSVNGETNRLICSMRCHEQQDGYHPVQIDFSPLGLTVFTYQAFYEGELVAQSPPKPGYLVAYGNYFNPLYPRVNPFWRMRDGSVGALIEFPTLEDFPGPNLDLPGVGEVLADRLFIRLDELTNRVDFTSRLDVFGGGGLEWFSIYDARLGMFRRPHKALPNTLLQAAAGTLTLARVAAPDDSGVAIELEQSGRFDVTFAPIQFLSNATLVVSAIGVGSSGSGDTLGTARITGAADELALSAYLAIAPTNVQTIVYRQGMEVVRQTGSNALIRATARLLGCAVQARHTGEPPGFHLRLDRTVPITLPDQTSHDGDEVRFATSDPAIFVALETLVLTASAMDLFTIAAEAEQEAARPRLHIFRAPDAVTLSWIDPNKIFTLESTPSLTLPFYWRGITPAYTTGTATVSFELDGSTHDFFRLSTTPRPRYDDD